MSMKILAGLVLCALLGTFGCGPEQSGSLRIDLVKADREVNQSILLDPEFVELEVLVEGDALGGAVRRAFFAGTRGANIPNLPVGKNYRVSVFGIAAGADGRAEPHFFGRSGAFDMVAGQNRVIPIQIGRSNCIGMNKSTNVSGQMAGSYDLVTARDGFATAVLGNGQMLIIGGGDVDQTREVAEPTTSIEVFDPISYAFRDSDLQLNTPRAYHTATPLFDGSVLVFGGISAVGGQVSTTAELIIPGEVPLVIPIDVQSGWSRYQHEAIRLDSDGSVLIVGGYDELGNLTSSALRYFPQTREFVEQGGLSSPRARGAISATRLTGYPAAYSGGVTDAALARTLELFSTRTDQGDPATGSPPCNDGRPASAMRGCFVNYQQLRIARSHHKMLSAYGGTELLIIGGYTNVPQTTSTNTVERFRRDAGRGTLVDEVGNLPFSGGEIAALTVPQMTGGRGGSSKYVVAGGFNGLSINRGAALIRESRYDGTAAATYDIAGLGQACDLPEPRVNLQMADTGNQTVLLMGGHRYDGQSWVATRRVEVYFPDFEAAIFE